VPLKPVPFTRQTFTEKDLNPFVADREEVIRQLRESRTGEPYLPVTRQRTIIFPGSDGGAQWGGAAADPDGILYVPAKEIPVYTSLTDAPVVKNLTSGEKLYQANCASCHGPDRKGDHSGAYPSLLDVSARLKPADIHQVMSKGRGMMPAFSHLPEAQRNAIVDFLNDKTGSPVAAENAPARTWVPYVHTGYNRWYDKNNYPVNQPPWGTLTAIDLNTGEHKWQVPLGEFPALIAKGMPPTGTDNYGGPLVTESGLLFIAATPDQKLRAFDRQTGKLLWEALLPAGGYASPSTYSVNGKQYIVIACGGGKLRSRSGDRYVAFALKGK
jgi:quinoprotein glucose dehydrogenase